LDDIHNTHTTNPRKPRRWLKRNKIIAKGGEIDRAGGVHNPYMREVMVRGDEGGKITMQQRRRTHYLSIVILVYALL
jgi:hypothetical protein